jgi:hypothetical protein
MSMAFLGAIASFALPATTIVAPKPLDVGVPKITSPTAVPFGTWTRSDDPKLLSTVMKILTLYPESQRDLGHL